jgi:F-type H+-transporting ATPase subunit b
MDPMLKSLHFMAGVNLDFDMTFVIQLVIVLVLMLVFRQFIFTPYLKILDERDRRTDSTREEAASLKSQAESLATEYETSLAAARKTAMDTKRQLRTDGIEEKDTLISAARAEANQTVETAQAAIKGQVASERELLDEQVNDLAALVVQKVIGRQV